MKNIEYKFMQFLITAIIFNNDDDDYDDRDNDDLVNLFYYWLYALLWASSFLCFLRIHVLVQKIFQKEKESERFCVFAHLILPYDSCIFVFLFIALTRFLIWKLIYNYY